MEDRLIKINSIKHNKNYTNKIKQASLSINLDINNHKDKIKYLYEFDLAMEKFFKISSLKNLKDDNIDILNRILTVYKAIIKTSKIPLFNNIYLELNQNNVTINMPVLGIDAQLHEKLFLTLINFLNGVENKNFEKDINDIFNLLLACIPKTGNQKDFLYIANKKNIVYKQLNQNIFQYGYCKNKIFLDTTATSFTSFIGLNLARDKEVAKAILRDAGLSVVDGFDIKSKDEAIQKAKEIGFPVVVKPKDSDGSKGVFSLLNNEIEVAEAFEKALIVSNNIIMEKYISLREYRINVFNNEIINAYERTPCVIKGDGIKTIQNLIDDLNKKREIEKKEFSYINIIEIDDEINEVLKSNKFSLNSVLKKEESLRLKKDVSQNTGGNRIHIKDFSIFHNDIFDLISKITKLFKLDLFGIDMFIKDITLPLNQNEYYICEVNGKPRIRETFALEAYINKLIPNNGEVPTIIVLGKENNKLISKVSKIAKKNKKNLAVLKSFENANIYMSDDSIDCMLIFIEKLDDIKNGYPIKNTNFILLDNIDLNEEKNIDLIKNLTNYFAKKLLVINELSDIDKAKLLDIDFEEFSFECLDEIFA